MRQLTVWFVFAIFCSIDVQATTPISGSDAPDYRHAVQTWLADDDETSLPALSALAHKGNTSARLLLARIEATDRSYSPYLRSLSRSQWHTLFRSIIFDGAFARSWIRVESERGLELAQRLKDATQLGIHLLAIEKLLESGEPEAAEHLIRKVAVDGSDQQRDHLLTLLTPEHELWPYISGFRHARDGLTTGHTALQRIIDNNYGPLPNAVSLANDAVTRNARIFVDIGYQAGDRMPDFQLPKHYSDALVNWVLNAPAAIPVATLCQRSCLEAEVSACVVTAFGLVGGYYEVIRFDSPVENLISQHRFLHSERALGMVQRRIANARSEVGDIVFSPTALAAKSQCLASAVADW
ncbi:hypothetical protein AB833_04680 [Chromatiales bacterium (ex Bugula neritina AB1)]|nr:hypothetical protein AB833_04680 [Chromatiales bacterium (ex Bugula neritina AB1)]